MLKITSYRNFICKTKQILSRSLRKINTSEKVNDTQLSAENLFEFHGEWPREELVKFKRDMRLMPNFLSETEERKLLEEIEPYMKRLRYEFDHWDDAIHGFRETERKHWYPHNREIIERVRHVAFQSEIMSYVHILDLAEDGVIKPHVDSTRYCGDIISGMSLLSDSVMRLVRTQEDPGDQSKNNEYRNQPVAKLENNFYVDILLPRRSLYVMSYTSRYNFTHEILAKDKSYFRGALIPKTRRISIICRNEAGLK